MEHAAQVARTLPGGLDLLGLYLLCDNQAFSSAEGVVINALKGVREEVMFGPSSLLVLHIDAVSAKVSAKEIKGGALRPCEVKSSALLPQMVALQCQYPLNLAVSLAEGKQRLHDAIQGAIQWEHDVRVAPALSLIDGNMLPEGSQIGDAAPAGAGAIAVELLHPVGVPVNAIAAVGATAAGDSGEYERYATIALGAVLDCRAFVHKRETVEAAIEALKSDVQRTLLARLEVLYEAAEMATAFEKGRADKALSKGEKPEGGPPKHPLLLRVGEVRSYRPSFPRRAFLKWTAGGCCYCDYVVDGEGVSEALDRMAELMGPDAVDGATFQCEEKASGAASSGKRGRRKAGGPECKATLLAAAVALLAIAYATGYFSL